MFWKRKDEYHWLRCPSEHHGLRCMRQEGHRGKHVHWANGGDYPWVWTRTPPAGGLLLEANDA